MAVPLRNSIPLAVVSRNTPDAAATQVDQVSVLYAPSADGQVPSRTFVLPHATSDTLDVWDEARMAARQFWEQASDDARLSDDVRSVCAADAKLLVN
jgi:hypothetical protein